MIVISDTSPLSNLFAVGKLQLLQQLYGKIIIPAAVMDELAVLENRGIDLSGIRNALWIEIKDVSTQEDVKALLNDLDLGEAESIVLAKEMHADWLLMDEAKGRTIAKNMGLPVIGLLGVLILAKEKGVITSVMNILDEIIAKAKFRVSPELYLKVKELTNE